MMYDFSSITFAAWGYIVPFIVVTLCVFACCMWMYYKQRKAIKQLVSTRWQSIIFSGFSLSKRFFKAICLTLSCAMVCVALMRPQWGKTEEVIQQEGRDLFIVLDVSRSMLARDVQPNRLQAAKAKIKSLINHLQSERVGLILFSGSAFVQCPLTTDIDALYMFLHALDAETISSGTTALDQAIQKAQESFETNKSATKLVVIITDGEDFSGNLQSVTRKAREAGLTICTLGMATEHGAPVPIVNQEGKQVGHELDDSGNVILSRLNEGILSNVAQEGGGMYVRVTNDEADVIKIATFIERFEKSVFDDQKVTTLHERYYYPLAAALVLFLCTWMV